MPDLKLDLLNKLGNDKYYAELELGRVSNDPIISYKEKINTISEILAEIALLNAQLQLTEQYYTVPDKNTNQGQVVQQAPKANATHPGQTHGE